MIDNIFKRDIDDVEVGLSIIHLYSKEEFADAQIGYRITKKGEKIKEWVGDNYYVIGNDSCCGDPIIVDTSDSKLPVYSMFHDDWSMLVKITNSYEQYLDILKEIDNTDLSDEDSCNKLTDKILKSTPKEGNDYWEALIESAYEFINDID